MPSKKCCLCSSQPSDDNNSTDNWISLQDFIDDQKRSTKYLNFIKSEIINKQDNVKLKLQPFRQICITCSVLIKEMYKHKVEIEEIEKMLLSQICATYNSNNKDANDETIDASKMCFEFMSNEYYCKQCPFTTTSCYSIKPHFKYHTIKYTQCIATFFDVDAQKDGCSQENQSNSVLHINSDETEVKAELSVNDENSVIFNEEILIDKSQSELSLHLDLNGSNTAVDIYSNIEEMQNAELDYELTPRALPAKTYTCVNKLKYFT